LLVRERVALGAGLDDHHDDVVGDEVVQLARDAGALLGHRLVGAQRVLALEQLGARGERLGLELASADRPAEEQHGDDRDDREEHRVARVSRALSDVVEEVARDEQTDADQEAAGVRPHRDRVQRDPA
jgi:hypothetical protein